jgi:hypothetical protein
MSWYIMRHESQRLSGVSQSYHQTKFEMLPAVVLEVGVMEEPKPVNWSSRVVNMDRCTVVLRPLPLM